MTGLLVDPPILLQDRHGHFWAQLQGGKWIRLEPDTRQIWNIDYVAERRGPLVSWIPRPARAATPTTHTRDARRFMPEWLIKICT